MNKEQRDYDKISIDLAKGLGELSARFVGEIVAFADEMGINRTKAVNVCVQILSYATNKNISYDRYRND